MQERKLLMRLPAGQRFIIEYDKAGASLYAIATPARQVEHFCQADSPAKTETPGQRMLREIRERWDSPPEPKPPAPAPNPRPSDRLLKRRE
jgi:hypothetical protein